MARRAGTGDLPLHSGHVPKWLADRMTRLDAMISEAIVQHYGRDELLRRLADPFWFSSASMLAIIGGFSLIGSAASGWLCDRFNPRVLLFW
jgi:hypothetical protein